METPKYIHFFMETAQKTVNVGLYPQSLHTDVLLPPVLALQWLRYLDRCKMCLSQTAIFYVNALSSGLETMSQRSV
jgi:hypothetical protein